MTKQVQQQRKGQQAHYDDLPRFNKLVEQVKNMSKENHRKTRKGDSEHE